MFKKLNVILLCLLLISLPFTQTLSANRVPKIIGGRASDTGAWSWMVTLNYHSSSQNNASFCGATLIAKNWVLTAAHCVANQTPNSIYVVANNQTSNTTNESLPIKHIIVHPAYNSKTFKNDLALIELINDSQISPIKLLSPHTTQDAVNKMAIALGWGTISTTENIYPTDLQQVNLSIIDSSTCSQFMGNITENMLCAGDKTYQKDTCQGDSGGPLIVFDSESNVWRQAGITSWGFGCAKVNTYGVYTRIRNYANFISKTICTDKKPNAPKLGLIINANSVTATWTHLDDVSGYRLNYALYSKPETVYSIDMNKLTQFSINLPSGSAYYIAISSYVDNCLSNYSNIGAFNIK
jgi:secreted trypsin-like serine protease